MTTTGRQSTSLDRELGKVLPVVFSKAGAVSVAAFGGRFYNNSKVAKTVKRVHASLGTAPTGATAIFDVKINGTTVYTSAGDRPTIAISAFSSDAVGGTAPTKSGDAIILLPGQYLTVEATQVGSSVAGSDANVQVFLG